MAGFELGSASEPEIGMAGFEFGSGAEPGVEMAGFNRASTRYLPTVSRFQTQPPITPLARTQSRLPMV